jgi:hypothetical protein
MKIILGFEVDCAMRVTTQYRNAIIEVTTL